jgi:hypothetical protein
MGNSMADLLLKGRVKTERDVGQWVLLLSHKGVIRRWNGKRGDGCGEKIPWEERFLFLVYHVAQSLRFARKVTARLLKICYHKGMKLAGWEEGSCRAPLTPQMRGAHPHTPV